MSWRKPVNLVSARFRYQPRRRRWRRSAFRLTRRSLFAGPRQAYASKSILTPVVEDKGNCLRQILARRIHGDPLTVSPRYFGAVRYIPIVFFLNYCREFVSQFAHTPTIKRR